jgi:xanthine dehydrogenase accessory factor
VWLNDGYAVDLVTLVRTWGSAPRPVGSLAAVRGDGAIVGSVSGGCVEKQLAARHRRAATDQAGLQLVEHEVSREQALRFGLSCGGTLHLVFEPLEHHEPLVRILDALQQRQRVVREVNLQSGVVEIRAASRDDEFVYDGRLLRKVFGPRWRLLLIGAGQLSRHVAEMAQALDYEVIVCEPRNDFLPAWHTPEAIVTSLSPDDAVDRYARDPQSAVLALTHDPNLDDIAMMQALPSEAFYVGSLGSVRNNENRRKRLLALDLSQSEVDRLHGPIGLPIGSRTPAEIAISILAELTAVRYAAPPGAGHYPRRPENEQRP